jgi:cytochrome c biogenesis protein CcmG/thiol:disulfide interchange protein DsbE
MTNRQQWFVVFGVLAGLALLLSVATVAMRAEGQSVDIGSTAPIFEGRVLDSKTVKSLADYKGQVVLLNVWATWCAPCRVEMPSIEQLHRRLGPLGLKVVAVSVDEATVSDSTLRAFAKDLGLSFEILRDPEKTIADRYQTTGYPETFFIDRDGRIRKKWIGSPPPPEVWDTEGNRALLRQLLGLSPREGGDTARAGALAPSAR